MLFRKDINTLRAFAVLTVLFYHFFPTLIPGGFIGVDVFFVISGFLMTGIILRGIESNSFRLLNFYRARAQKILPPLIIVCLVLLVFGRLILPPTQLEALSEHIYKSLLFVSNIQYAKESGYFDVAATEKWLLHTWSLSIEWQFYLLYPFFLLALTKVFSRDQLKRIILLTTLAFFAYGTVHALKNPQTVYFSFTTRIWEMLFGGVVYLYQSEKNSLQQRLSAYLGYSLLIVSALIFNSGYTWPSAYTAIPILSAGLIIFANNVHSTINRVSFFQMIGTYSYSIYLWHWVMLVLLVYTGFDGTWERLLGMLASLALGWASYEMVEKNIKKRPPNTESRTTAKSILTSVWFWAFWIVGLTAAVVKDTDGALGSYADDVRIITHAANNRNPRINQCHSIAIDQACTYGSGEIKAIVIGDSHATGYMNAIAKSVNGGVLEWTQNSCATLKNMKTRTSEVQDWDTLCAQRINTIFQEVAHYPGVPIFMINRTSALIEGVNEPDRVGMLNQHLIDVDGTAFNQRSNEWKNSISKALYQTACELSKTNPVIMFRDTPEYGVSVPLSMAKKAMVSDDIRVSMPVADYNNRTLFADFARSKASTDCNVSVLDFSDLWCDENRCYADKDSRPLYYDDDHLSEFGASLIVPKLSAFWSSNFQHR
ncbi:TPA: acyltransferase family protein [Vibrio vulnificus]|nr:acyltransferase family protein [Vibrio vulnificus]